METAGKPHKSVLINLNKKRKMSNLKIVNVDNISITEVRVIKNLGVHLDRNLSSKVQVNSIIQKTSASIQLYAAYVSSMILYAGPVWINVTKMHKDWRQLRQNYKG